VCPVGTDTASNLKRDFCLNGAPKDNFFTNPDLVSETAENAWIAGITKWMMPSTPYNQTTSITNDE